MTLGLLASQAAVLLAGYALLRAVGIAELKPADVRLIGLSYLAGWALTGVLVSLALVLGIGESLPELLVLLAVEIGGLLWLGGRAKPLGEASSPVVQSRHPLAVVVCWVSGAILAVAIVCAAAVASKTGTNAWHQYDAYNIWIPRAEILYASHGLNAPLWKSFAHPEYPPLAPGMDALTFFFAGPHPSLLVTQRALLGIAFLLSLVPLLGRAAPRWLVLPFVAALATAPWFWARLGSLMVDAPVAYLVCAAATTGFLWLHERRRTWLVLTLIFIAGAGLTKFEGFFFSEILALTILVVALLRYRRAGLPSALLVSGPLLIGAWWLWLGRHGISASNSADYHLSDVFDVHYLGDRTFRLTTSLTALREEAAQLVADGLAGWHVPAVSAWVLALPVILALALAARCRAVLVGAAAAWTLCAFAGLAVIYWIGRPEIGWYLWVTVDRIVPTVIVTSGTLVTLILGLELPGSGAGPEPGTASPGAKPATRPRVATMPLFAAAGALTIAAVADGRPLVARTGTVDTGALGRELSVQFEQELNSAGYLYPVTASCGGAPSGGLDYLCVVATAEPVRTEVLHWNVSVNCSPTTSGTPRCSTDRGEALG